MMQDSSFLVNQPQTTHRKLGKTFISELRGYFGPAKPILA